MLFNKKNQDLFCYCLLTYLLTFFVFAFIQLVLSQKRIDLMSMLGVYVVLGVGIVCAFLTLIAEIVWKRRKEKQMISKRFESPIENRFFFYSAFALIFSFPCWYKE